MIVTLETRPRGVMYDANGSEVRDCIWANTETGEVVRYVREATGQFRIDDSGVVSERVTLPAPFRLQGFKAAKS